MCKSLPKQFIVGLFITIAYFILFLICSIDLQSRKIMYLSRSLIFSYLLIIIPILKTRLKWTSSIMLFTMTFCLFFLSRILVSFFDDSNLFDSNKYVFYQFSISTISTILVWLGLSITALYIGFFISYSHYRPNYRVTKNLAKHNPINNLTRKYIWIAVFITLPGMIYKSIFDLYIIYKYGYMILYIEIPEIAPVWARMSWGAFKIIFPCLLVFCDNKIQFKKIVIFYFVVSIVSFIKGTRGELIIPIIYFMWFYYAKFSSQDLSIKKLIYLFVFISIAASVMLLTRGSELNLNIFEISLALILTQGVQYVFLGNFIDYQTQFPLKSHFYILFPFISMYQWFFNPIFRKGQSVELAHHSLSLDDQVMFATNPDAYLEGAGYGSSYIPELYALGGIFAIILGSLILGFIINWFDSKFSNRAILTIISWYWISALVWMPRGSYFINPFMPLLTILFYLAVKSVAKRKYNSNIKLQHELYPLNI